MPTPFTHLEIAQRLLRDEALPEAIRACLISQRSAFLLGSIVADARVNSGLSRDATHFYRYDAPISEHPWRVMMRRFPTLQTPLDAAHRAFIAGYVAHLSVDETWALQMFRPHFFDGEWSNRYQRFLMLHIILIYMDERDYDLLEAWQYPALCAATPTEWLPFMDDATLVDWRNFIGLQIAPDGESQTLHVLGTRVAKTPQELRSILDSPQKMQHDLWRHVSPDLLARVEHNMYIHAREQLRIFYEETDR